MHIYLEAEYHKLVELYKAEILGFLQTHGEAMGHPDPNYAAQPCAMLCQLITDGAVKLRQAELLHQPFYEAVGAISALAYDLIPDDAGGAAWDYVSRLEHAVEQLSPTISSEEAQQIRQELGVGKSSNNISQHF